MDANFTCSPPAKNLTDGEQIEEQHKSQSVIKREVWKDFYDSFHTLVVFCHKATISD